MPTRKPLGRALTVEELIQAVGSGETPSDALDAQVWWERYAPTYAVNWLSALPRTDHAGTPDTTPRPLLRERG